MYNYGFKTTNWHLEQKIIGICEERGYKWRKTGLTCYVFGVDEQVRTMIEVRSDSFWDLDD